ncbi:hypothetical protein BJ742DRAFT_771452 [Cladochytrium replicatum]|nr:hypothetical protein BJ742DRAFT_771452 [Cladochytrium replicatum]
MVLLRDIMKSLPQLAQNGDSDKGTGKGKERSMSASESDRGKSQDGSVQLDPTKFSSIIHPPASEVTNPNISDAGKKPEIPQMFVEAATEVVAGEEEYNPFAPPKDDITFLRPLTTGMRIKSTSLTALVIQHRGRSSSAVSNRTTRSVSNSNVDALVDALRKDIAMDRTNRRSTSSSSSSNSSPAMSSNLDPAEASGPPPAVARRMSLPFHIGSALQARNKSLPIAPPSMQQSANAAARRMSKTAQGMPALAEGIIHHSSNTAASTQTPEHDADDADSPSTPRRSIASEDWRVRTPTSQSTTYMDVVGTLPAPATKVEKAKVTPGKKTHIQLWQDQEQLQHSKLKERRKSKVVPGSSTKSYRIMSQETWEQKTNGREDQNNNDNEQGEELDQMGSMSRRMSVPATQLSGAILTEDVTLPGRSSVSIIERPRLNVGDDTKPSNKKNVAKFKAIAKAASLLNWSKKKSETE